MHGYFLLEHDSLVMLLLLCQMSSLLALHMIMPFLNGLPWTFLSFFIISSISFFSLYGHSVSFTVSAAELPGDDSYTQGSVTNVITTKLHHSVLYKFGNSACKLIGYLSEYLMV